MVPQTELMIIANEHGERSNLVEDSAILVQIISAANATSQFREVYGYEPRSIKAVPIVI